MPRHRTPDILNVLDGGDGASEALEAWSRKFNSVSSPDTRARILEKFQRQRAIRDLGKSVIASQGYLRNSPVDRTEVTVRDFQICTIPVSAMKLDGNDDPANDPAPNEHLFADLVAELTVEWQAAHRPKRGIYDKSGSRIDEPEPKVPFVYGPPKQCKWCGNWFFVAAGWVHLGGRAKTQYCSDTCIASGTQLTVKSYIARRSKLRTLSHSHCCKQCGEPMASTRSTKAYCSSRCRTAAFRKGGQSLSTDGRLLGPREGTDDWSRIKTE